MEVMKQCTDRVGIIATVRGDVVVQILVEHQTEVAIGSLHTSVTYGNPHSKWLPCLPVEDRHSAPLQYSIEPISQSFGWYR